MDGNCTEETARRSMLLFLILAVLFAVLIGTSVVYLSKEGERAPAAAPTPTPPAETPAARTPTPGATPAAEVTIAVIPTLKFDKAELIVPAGQAVTVKFDNRDTGVPHNFAVYTDKSARQLTGKADICSGPCQKTLTLQGLRPGEYFFRCDVHPQQMVGKFIVR